MNKIRDRERKVREEQKQVEYEKKKAAERESELKKREALEKAKNDAERLTRNSEGGLADMEDDEDLCQIITDQHDPKEVISADVTIEANSTAVEEVSGEGMSEVSKIFGKGASKLSFKPVQSSTPNREESKRNASIGSDGQIESDLDSSKKLRLDFSPNKKDPPDPTELEIVETLGSQVEGNGSGLVSSIPHKDMASVLDSNVEVGHTSDPATSKQVEDGQEEVSVLVTTHLSAEGANIDVETSVQHNTVNRSGEGFSESS